MNNKEDCRKSGSLFCSDSLFLNSLETDEIQVEQPRDLARDSGQRKLTYSFQNHCASSQSVYFVFGLS